jgi:ribosomal-protein-alanine N-acetyltransferase
VSVGEILLRKLVVSDVDTVAALERSIFTDPWSRSVFMREAQLGDDSWNRVAVDEVSGRILGYLVAWFVADEVHLANVGVDPDLRRGGLAQQLLDEMIEEGSRRGARLVLLEVRRSNIVAQAFYEKNGFSTVTVRRRYYQDNREDALVMIKPLSDEGPSAESI